MAWLTTSSTVSTGMIFKLFLTLAGISSKSLTLSFGIKIVFNPLRCAAIDFSRKPPIGSTLPDRKSVGRERVC